MRAIWKRELRAYFYTPVGYVFLCVFLSAASVIFYLTLLSRGSGDLPAFISFLSLLWMLLSPILAMRLLAEERQKKTDQLLLTSPVSLPSAVLGKYLAAVTVLVIATVFTLTYAWVISIYGKVYPAELAVNLLGFLLLGCAFTAMDLFISSCAANPVTAGVMAFGANFFLWILDLVEQAVPVAWISDVLRFISLYQRNEPLIAGELSFAAVIFDLSFAGAFLALTVFRLDGRRIRRLRYRAVSALLTVMLISSMALLSVGARYLEKRNGWSVDASFNSITSHTDATRQMLDELPSDVRIQALFARGNEDIELMALLDRYAANPHITWEQTDPRLNPGLVRQYTTTTRAPEEFDLLVTCEDTGRWRLIKSDEYIGARTDPETGETVYDQLNYERVISGAIDYVSRERVPRVVILYGFREDIDRNNAAFLEWFLTSNRYEVAYQRLDDPSFTPDKQDLLVFLSPQRDLTDEEFRKVEAFTEAGGSILFTRDADDPAGEKYGALLRTYGFIPLEGVVVATDPNTYYDNIPTYLLPAMESTDMTMDLQMAEADHIRIPLSAAFEMPPEKTDRFLNTAAVLTMPDTAYLEQDDTPGRSGSEPSGPFALALRAWRVTSGDVSNVSRAFIIGNTGAVMSPDSYAVTDMPFLIIRAMDYLLDIDSTSLDIVSRDAARPLLKAGDKRTGAVMIVALPAAALLAALLVLPKRRRF